MTQSSPNQAPSLSPPDPSAPSERTVAYHLGVCLGLLNGRYSPTHGNHVARTGNVYEVLSSVCTQLRTFVGSADRLDRKAFIAACVELEADDWTDDERRELRAGRATGHRRYGEWVTADIDIRNAEWSGDAP